MKRFTLFILVVLFGLPCCVESHGQRQAEPIRIAMKETVSSFNGELRVGDLATITGGDSVARERISKLDLAIEQNASGPSSISKSEVLARVLLAGVGSQEFEISGPEEVQLFVETSASWEQTLVNSIARHVSQAFNIDERDVLVEVQTKESDRQSVGQLTGSPTFQPLDHGDRLIGRRFTELVATDQRGKSINLRVLTHIGLARSILVTSRPIEIGEILDESNTRVERRTIYRASDITESPETMLGKPSKRRLRAQQTVRLKDVGTPRTAASSAPTVKARDIVNVVAVKSGLRITLSGAEALRGGRVGEVIPLRNPTSNEKIYGRIKSSDLVELIY